MSFNSVSSRNYNVIKPTVRILKEFKVFLRDSSNEIFFREVVAYSKEEATCFVMQAERNDRESSIEFVRVSRIYDRPDQLGHKYNDQGDIVSITDMKPVSSPKTKEFTPWYSKSVEDEEM